jgi:two-component system, NarL family, nitrate/nitrite response regulator NarL
MGTNFYPRVPGNSSLAAAGFTTVKVRAVVVDDTGDFAELAAELLEADGNVEVVATASNGIEAVKMVRMFDPELVLMDINMPRLNGLLATLQIRELGCDTRILIMSSADEPEIGLSALDCGADGFIGKSRLVRELRLHLDRLFPSRGRSRSIPPKFAGLL